LNGFFRLNFMEIEVKFYVPVQRRIVIFRHKNFNRDVSSKSHSRKPSSKAAFRPYPRDITAIYSTHGAGLEAATSGYICRAIVVFIKTKTAPKGSKFGHLLATLLSFAPLIRLASCCVADALDHGCSAF
jgi:hypothetical protein